MNSRWIRAVRFIDDVLIFIVAVVLMVGIMVKDLILGESDE